ncbi:hypothetical protein, partial [Escherichia coli]|uniref:hypothetical protein n=1 Tax=Escherichia coli TaxID=562 RepID=UPI001BC8C5BC
SLQGKISSDGCLKKEQMVVSAIASTPQGPLLSKRGGICFVNHFQNNFSGIKPGVDLSHLDIFRLIGAYLSQEFFIPKAFLAAALTG